MNRFFTKTIKIILAAGLSLVYGCMSVEYVGQSFPELPESEPIKIYSAAAPLTSDDYRVIGRVTIQAPDGTTQGDVWEELTELARKHGAEAVNILDFKRVRIGSYAVESEQPRRVGWNRDGRNAGGAYIYSNYFGEVSTLEGRRTNVTELQINAVLLVSGKKFKEMQALNKKEQKHFAEKDAAKQEKKSDAAAEEALNKSVKPLEVSPLQPYKEDPKPERQPSSVELSADHRPAVSL